MAKNGLKLHCETERKQTAPYRIANIDGNFFKNLIGRKTPNSYRSNSHRTFPDHPLVSSVKRLFLFARFLVYRLSCPNYQITTILRQKLITRFQIYVWRIRFLAKRFALADLSWHLSFLASRSLQVNDWTAFPTRVVCMFHLAARSNYRPASPGIPAWNQNSVDGLSYCEYRFPWEEANMPAFVAPGEEQSRSGAVCVAGKIYPHTRAYFSGTRDGM